MMQREIGRRIASLELSILPLSVSVFMARVKAHGRRTGVTYWSAFDFLISKASDDELERLETELEQMVFGGDTVARDAAKREALAAAGYPDWNPSGDQSRDEGW
jgi:hypothetical protein